MVSYAVLDGPELTRFRLRNSFPRFSTMAKPGGGVAEKPFGGRGFSGAVMGSH